MLYYDALEIRPEKERAQAQFALLRSVLHHANQHVPAMADALAAVDIASITDRKALASLPLIRKSALSDLQSKAPPFGGYSATSSTIAQIFQSPGPLYEPMSRDPDPCRTARALHAAGFRSGDLVHNCFSYHMTPAGMMMERGALALGCTVFPAGTAPVEQQLQAIAHLRPQAYVGTPDFLLTLLERADAQGLDAINSINKALVSGMALMPEVRQKLTHCGIEVKQCYATAEIGLIAYETEPDQGMISDEGVIIEIVQLGSGDTLPIGDIGELVVSVLNHDYPLIRFATGDLSAVQSGGSRCGRTGMRIKGWMGRTDETTKVRGMFIHPRQLEQVCDRHPQLKRIRAIVDRVQHKDRLRLQCETLEATPALVADIEDSVRMLCNVRAKVELVPPDTLPGDSKLIDDIRRYD